MPEIENTQIVPEAPVVPKYRERLRKRYADVDPQTDAEWDDLTERGFAEDEERLNLFDENNKVMTDLLNSDKDLKAVISDMLVNGTPFRAAVVKFFDPEDLVAKEGDEDYDYYQKSVDERRRMGEAFQQRVDQKAANEQEAYDNIDAFAAAKEMSDEDKNGFIAFINGLFDDLMVLKITPETLEKLYKAMNYDKDVAEAAETGEMQGKNEAIEATRVKKAIDVAADGVPTPAGGSAPVPEAKPRRTTIFDDIPQRKF